MSPLQRSDFHCRSSRRSILLAEFGFECRCGVCEADDHAEDDAKRKRVLQIEEEWSDLGE